MKFKIMKNAVDRLLNSFEKDAASFVEIELNPVADTATEAILHNGLRHEGYKLGYRKGWLDGHEEERRARLGLPPKHPLHCACHCHSCTHRICYFSCNCGNCY